MECHFATDCLRVYLHPKSEVLEMEWLGFASGPTFREAIQQTYQLARQYGVRHLLVNNGQLRAIRASDQTWLATELELSLKIELECVALVESTDAMNRMAVAGFLRQYTADWPVVRQFENVAAARSWLLAAPTSQAV